MMNLGTSKVSYLSGQFYFEGNIISPGTAWEMAENNLARVLANNKALRDELEEERVSCEAVLKLADTMINARRPT
ncbi:MAG: hypothetical protein COB36_12110 [Alphaproteobacteria bacterium]|nr:MAG: hypothetical protein COB36_12110 [Alphaproteobacteria bacterium]